MAYFDWYSTVRKTTGPYWQAIRLPAGRIWQDNRVALRRLLRRLVAVESGAVAAEYAFLIAFISILAAIGMVVLGDDLQDYFQALATAIDNASQPTPDSFAS